MRDFMERALGGELCEATKAKWDDLCRDYYENAMGSPPGITWHDVHVPFGISYDNAAIHKAWRKEALAPRVPISEEFRSLFEHAIDELQFDIHKEFIYAADAVIAKYDGIASRARKRKSKTAASLRSLLTTKLKARYSGNAFYVMVQFLQFDFTGVHTQLKQRLAMEVFDALHAKFQASREAYQLQHQVDWVSVFRRAQALRAPRWLCFLPEQFMPLGNATPDLHQTAELLVSLGKTAMRIWTMAQEPERIDVLKARNYDAKLQQTSRERNQPQESGLSTDQINITNSIERTWITAQMVATPYGTWFSPSKPPNPETGMSDLHDFEVMGTGDLFPEKSGRDRKVRCCALASR